MWKATQWWRFEFESAVEAADATPIGVTCRRRRDQRRGVVTPSISVERKAVAVGGSQCRWDEHKRERGRKKTKRLLASAIFAVTVAQQPPSRSRKKPLHTRHGPRQIRTTGQFKIRWISSIQELFQLKIDRKYFKL